MDAATEGRLATLAGEYVALVEAMCQGQYANEEEWRRLSADRTLVHDELLALTGMTRRDDMYVHCRRLLSAASSSSGSRNPEEAATGDGNSA